MKMASDSALWYVPRSFWAGHGRKVHVGVRRMDNRIYLACGMSGAIGLNWLTPTRDPYENVTCKHCLRATR
jgi:hypothetical protein